MTTATSLRGRRSALEVDGVRSKSLHCEAFPVKDFGYVPSLYHRLFISILRYLQHLTSRRQSGIELNISVWGRFIIFLKNYLHCWDTFFVLLPFFHSQFLLTKKPNQVKKEQALLFTFTKPAFSSFPLVSKHIHHPISSRRFKKKVLLPGIQSRYNAMKTENVESKSPRRLPLFDVLVSSWLCLGCGCSAVWFFCVKQVWVYCERLKWIEV